MLGTLHQRGPLACRFCVCALSLWISSSPDCRLRRVFLQLQMLGYDVSWAAFNIVEVMSSSKFTYKVRRRRNIAGRVLVIKGQRNQWTELPGTQIHVQAISFWFIVAQGLNSQETSSSTLIDFFCRTNVFSLNLMPLTSGDAPQCCTIKNKAWSQSHRLLHCTR